MRLGQHSLLGACNSVRTLATSGESSPAPIKFGRKYESKALNLFMRAHRYRHRKCSVKVPGLCMSATDCFIAASPDAIVDCKHCGQLLLEIKCMYSKQNMHPRAALKISDFCVCTVSESGECTFALKKGHAFFCQMQCQMPVTGLQRGVLVVFTKKGIESIEVCFDVEWWKQTLEQLRKFWIDSYFPSSCLSLSVIMQP